MWERTGGGATGNIGVETLASTYRLRSHKLGSGVSNLAGDEIVAGGKKCCREGQTNNEQREFSL